MPTFSIRWQGSLCFLSSLSSERAIAQNLSGTGFEKTVDNATWAGDAVELGYPTFLKKSVETDASIEKEAGEAIDIRPDDGEVTSQSSWIQRDAVAVSIPGRAFHGSERHIA